MASGVAVTVGQDEHLDKALRKFRRLVDHSGLLRDWRKYRCYVKPSERLRQKRANARRTRARRAAKQR